MFPVGVTSKYKLMGAPMTLLTMSLCSFLAARQEKPREVMALSAVKNDIAKQKVMLRPK